jgi:topoisomerase IV subunit B
MPAQLKETTMDRTKRTMLKVEIINQDIEATRQTVDDLMGTKPESRFRFIQERAEFVQALDI